MSTSRLTTALTDGLIVLPEGPVRIMRPSADYDLSALPRSMVQIDTGFKPDATAFAASGYTLGAAPAPVTIVVAPRSKTLARAMIAEAAATASLVIVDGHKTDGIDSLYKDCRARLGDLPCISKGHGRLFCFAGTQAFADWTGSGPVQGDHGFWTTAGVFSDGAVDRGSALLVSVLPDKLPSRMADLGAGWGYLSTAVLSRPGVETLDLVEAESLSLDCARMNVVDNRASFHWADATTWAAARPYGGIVMNPPFHTGRAGDPALGQAFIAAAARNLTPTGQLWMVANRHLPYEAILRQKFRTVEEIGGDGGFKVYHASRPAR